MHTEMSKFDQLLHNNAEIKRKLLLDGVVKEDDLPLYNDEIAWKDLKTTCGLVGNEFREIRKAIQPSATQSTQAGK